MIRAGTGVSSAAAAPAAVAEAIEAALEGLDGATPAAALLVASRHHAPALPAALRAVEDAVGGAPVVGATVDGVLRPGLDLEQGPAIGLWLVSGVEASASLIHPGSGAASGVAEDVTLALGRPPTGDDLLLLLPDSAGCDLRGLLLNLRRVAGAAKIVGAGAADAGDGNARIFAGGEVTSGGLAALWLRGPGEPRVGVTSSCRPVAGPFQVTRAEGHWVLALDGRPALDVYREVAREPLARDLRVALGFLLVGLAQGPDAGAAAEAPIVRAVAGIGEGRRGFALPEPVSRGQRLSFVLRDAAGAREDLRALLSRLAAAPAAAGIYVDCRQRGAALFGVAGLEAAYLERELPRVPILGIRSGWQLGPIAGETALLTHAAVLALLPG